jgi:hypothetical protein
VNCSIIFSLNAGMSSGFRLVTIPSSTTTSLSTQLPPALRMSVWSVGHDVSVRPARLLELDALEHVGGEDRHLLSCELLLCHAATSRLGLLSRRNGGGSRTDAAVPSSARARSSVDRAADF